MTKVLHVDSSGRGADSITRSLAERLADGLAGEGGRPVHRDLVEAPPAWVDAGFVAANFTPAEDRDDAKRARLAESDALVDELMAADVLVLGAPMYNFGIPAVLKAWVDAIARVGRTFRYTSDGPVGLLTGKRAYVVVATGGTQLGSEIDFATPYLRLVLGFVGISDVTFIGAEKGDRASAEARIEAILGEVRAA